MAKYLMALDAGTGSVRAVLFDTDGNQLGVSQQEWTHNEDPRFPGSMDFDWEFNWGLTVQCIQNVLTETQIDPHEIAGISTTCMREGIVLYDKDFKEIWACANVDARSDDEAAALVKQSATLEKEIYSVSGQTFALDALPRILWVKNKMPEIYEKVAYVSMFNDWLIYKLTGVMSSEPSNACTTGIFDLATRNWDTTVAAKCNIKTDIYPNIYESGSIVANVSESAAAETGLASNTPVVAGGGDAQLGCIGVGVVSPEQAAVFGGSFWQFEFNTDKPMTDPDYRVRVNCHAVPGIWQYEALAFYPGLVMRWYRDAFCQLEKQKALETGKDPYYYMNLEAEKIPAGSNGMFCAFSDVMNYINWKHAAPTFTNFALDPEKFNRYTFYRAIMENSAMVTRGNMELVASFTGKAPKEIIFASGASKSPLWCQILADVLNIPVHVPKVREATALGAAILAGIGVGVFDSLEETAKKLTHIEETYYPNKENNEVYNGLYDTWKQVYHAQLDLCDKKLTKNMWIAPGL
ncbi:autoinducer-2 kinase [Hespellia stercorisuis]|uniref:Autoinducer 2 (AI-2) kinase n=1 Tax=Hespellia stercorisuis DSM 15480 TaxID=1121950 RepID=A0A1M6J5E1_9FIRM|nr:autoinducer-2 kinase [Hespellia stercorisuis]SHJ41903.1 autoinducer 2 (AI-2) kinase [Hespellia stercorisuis DSM 15480]